jgi:hypothetical protein
MFKLGGIIGVLLLAACAVPDTRKPNMVGGSFCGAHDKMIALFFDNYSETEIGVGVNSTDQSIWQLLVSAEGSWSMIETNRLGASCVRASGTYWRKR